MQGVVTLAVASAEAATEEFEETEVEEDKEDPSEFLKHREKLFFSCKTFLGAKSVLEMGISSSASL